MIIDNDYNGLSSLCLFGPVGMGKTHLMKSIVCHVKKNRNDCKIEYISAEDFKEAYVNSVRQNALHRFKKKFADLDALLVDDAQFISSTTGSIEKEFSRILNSFVDNKKWIIIACDGPPNALKIDDRTKSRIHSGLKASIKPSDVNLRLMILKAKLRQMYQSYEVPFHLLEYIAENVIDSIRELESILQSIIRYAGVMNTKVVRDSIVHEIVGRHDIKVIDEVKTHTMVTDDAIIKAVCEFYKIKKSDLLGSSRVKKISRARAATAYIARNYTSMTLKDIGEMLDRKHSTVMYLINSVLDDKAFLNEISQLRGN
jgi:chromosomal replication initiator protein